MSLLKNLPNGYDTLIGENGVRLSGGQKQRISIARAILKKSPIILLDEATSSLDAESEEIVQNAINNLTKNKTTLVIAHRLSTIHNADKIFVLKNGKVVNSGNHDFLIKNCEEYKSLYKKQLNNLMILLYRVITKYLYPFLIIFIYFRKLLKKEDPKRFKEKIFSKFNVLKKKNLNLIWFHAASIGEFKSIIPIIKRT